MEQENPDSPNVTVTPPRVFLLCLVCGIVMHLLFSQTILQVSYAFSLIPGLIIIAGGFVFMMWGHGHFEELGVNVKTYLPAKELATGKAYSYSRNPMYVGFMAIFIGTGITAGSFWILLASLPLLLYLNFYVIPREESYLLRRFGEDYETYRKSVRRWL